MFAPSQDLFIYLSLLLGRKVRDEKTGLQVGRFHDAAAQVENVYPLLARIFIRSRLVPWPFYQVVPWEAVRKFDLEGIVVDASALQPISDPAAAPGEILLREEVLDQQIVDVGGAKVVRVNDLHLLRAEGFVLVALKPSFLKAVFQQPVDGFCVKTGGLTHPFGSSAGGRSQHDLAVESRKYF